MDIKSKKWKRIVSLAGLFLGTGLLAVDAVLAVVFLYSGGTDKTLKEAFRNDYQNTQAFEDYISLYLNKLISASCGADIDYRANYLGAVLAYSEAGDAEGETAVTELVEIAEAVEATGDDKQAADVVRDETAAQAAGGTVVADAAEAQMQIIKDSGYEVEWPVVAREGDWGVDTITYRFESENGGFYLIETQPFSFKWNLGDDKNVLYAVYEKGFPADPIYTNAEYGSLAAGLPEGYNFLLTLEDNTVTIQKDGKELDVYGNGYYSIDSQWYVPGYKNFPEESYPRELAVMLAVKEVPVQYYNTSGDTFASDVTGIGFNGCYSLYESLREARKLYVSWLAVLAAGAALLLLRFVFWRAGSEGKRQIAGGLSHIWWELKAVGFGLVFVIAACLFLFMLVEGSSSYAWELIHLQEWSGNFYVWLNALVAFAFIEVMGIVFYFSCVDLQYGRPWRNTIAGSLFRGFRRLWRMREQRLPFAKKLMHRYLGAFWPILLLGLFGIAVMLLMGISFGGSARWLPAFVFLLLAAGAGVVLYTQYRYAVRLDSLMTDVQDLTEQIRDIREGHMEAELEAPENSELKDTFENLNAIQEGMQTALEEQMKSERMKIELIANVSHDIKTPLTSIISYVEILKQEEGLPQDIRDYVNILENKSQRLKTMVQDVFEVSKAASGELPVKPEVLDYGKLLRQTLADMTEQIDESPVWVRTDIPEEPVPILADGQRLYRVFQNLLVNALKYSLEGSRIYVSLKTGDGRAVVTVKNTSRTELPAEVDFTERFVRGDSSRTDGGSGLGLSIARSFTEACGGVFQVRTDADLFTATVSFAMTEQKAKEEGEEAPEAETL